MAASQRRLSIQRQRHSGADYPFSHQIPLSLTLQPWAAPVMHDWCAPPARPQIFVVLTAAVEAFVNLKRRGMAKQQRNQTAPGTPLPTNRPLRRQQEPWGRRQWKWMTRKRRGMF